MELGIFIIATEYTIRIDELAREVEQRGFESLFLGEHSHIPVSRRSPFRGGAELPREYRHAFDPFVALATAAAVTTNHKAGVTRAIFVLPAAERDTALTRLDEYARLLPR